MASSHSAHARRAAHCGDTLRAEAVIGPAPAAHGRPLPSPPRRPRLIACQCGQHPSRKRYDGKTVGLDRIRRRDHRGRRRDSAHRNPGPRRPAQGAVPGGAGANLATAPAAASTRAAIRPSAPTDLAAPNPGVDVVATLLAGLVGGSGAAAPGGALRAI